MNYELKAIRPVSVLLNSIRIFLVVGLVVGGLSFFVFNRNMNPAIVTFWQKSLATLFFTLVYSAVVSAVLTLIAWLYNLYATNFKGISIHLEQSDE